MLDFVIQNCTYERKSYCQEAWTSDPGADVLETITNTIGKGQDANDTLDTKFNHLRIYKISVQSLWLYVIVVK